MIQYDVIVDILLLSQCTLNATSRNIHANSNTCVIIETRWWLNKFLSTKMTKVYRDLLFQLLNSMSSFSIFNLIDNILIRNKFIFNYFKQTPSIQKTENFSEQNFEFIFH